MGNIVDYLTELSACRCSFLLEVCQLRNGASKLPSHIPHIINIGFRFSSDPNWFIIHILSYKIFMRITKASRRSKSVLELFKLNYEAGCFILCWFVHYSVPHPSNLVRPSGLWSSLCGFSHVHSVSLVLNVVFVLFRL